MCTKALALSVLTSLQAPASSAHDPGVPEARGTTDLTAGGLRWRFDVDRVPKIALGDRGGQVFALPFTRELLLLLSSFDADPPVPVWISPVSTPWIGIEAATESDVYLGADLRPAAPDEIVLKLFRSRSSVPEWHYTFSPQPITFPAFDLSRDGETIVSVSNQSPPPATVLRVHDRSTGAALRTIVLPAFGITNLDLSSAGNVVAFSDDFGLYTVGIYEVEREELFTLPGAIPDRQALSTEGGTLATFRKYAPAGHHVFAHVRDPDGYRVVLDVLTPVHIRPIDVALSEDGSTLVASWWDEVAPQRAIVRAYDVATATMTMEHVDVGSAGTIYAGDVSVSADGSRFVASLFGAGAGVAAELAVYSKHSSQPIASYPEGGTVFEVAMSPDGQRFAASRAPTNGAYDHVSIELYELGGEDLVVRGAPRVGSTITFELHGAPGSRAALLRSFALARNPIDVPGVGTLHLDPGSISTTSIGVVPPSGVATYATNAHTIPSMIGRTVWFQGLTSRPRHLTTDFVQLTILP